MEQKSNELRMVEWGLFIETKEGATVEIQLPDKLAAEVSKFLSGAKTEDVVGSDTDGKILW